MEDLLALAAVRNDENEDGFRAQQARLKALTSNSSSPSQVRDQVVKQNLPRPPGLVDHNQARIEEDRAKRFNVAEKAAMALVVGEEAMKSEHVQSHINQMVKSTMATVHAQHAAPPVAKPMVVAAPPGMSLPVARSPVSPPPGMAIAPPPGLPAAVKRNPSTAAAASLPAARMVRAGSKNGSDRRLLMKENLVGNSTTEAMVEIHPGVFVSQPFLDLLAWKHPINSLGWLIFAVAILGVLVSKHWSTMTVWCMFALGRVITLKVVNVLVKLNPKIFASGLTPANPARLPGSFPIMTDVANLFSAVVLRMDIVPDTIRMGILISLGLIGFRVSIGIVFVLVLVSSSFALAIYSKSPSNSIDFLLGPSSALKKVLKKMVMAVA